MQLSIGVDIGGTKIAVGLVDSCGTVISRKSFPTDITLGPEAITDNVADQIAAILQKEKVEIGAVGVGMAGQIDPDSGVVHFAPNLGWKEFPLAKMLNDRVRVPVVVVNDVRSATWGEWMFGAGKGQKDLVCLFVGTGIGGGIVSNGVMMTGAANCAGELGHIIIDFKGRQCNCGNFGCLEALASGSAIGLSAREFAAKNPQSGKLLIDLAGGDRSAITAKVVSNAARQNDSSALQLLDAAIEALIAGVISVVHAFNPSSIVLGGGVVENNLFIVEKVRAGVQKKALAASTKNLMIEESLLKADAGIVGAAYCAKRFLEE